MSATVTGTPTGTSVNGVTSPRTFPNAVTVPSGTTLLVIGVEIGYNVADATRDPTAVTFGGASLTPYSTALRDSGNYQALRFFYQFSPTPSTADVVVTYTAAGASNVYIGCVCCTGSDTGTAFRSGTTGTGTSGAESTTLTGTTAGDLILDLVCNGAGTAMTVNGSQSQQFQTSQTAYSTLGGSTKAAGGDITMAWTSDSDLWAQIVVAVQAETTGPGSGSDSFTTPISDVMQPISVTLSIAESG